MMLAVLLDYHHHITHYCKNTQQTTKNIGKGIVYVQITYLFWYQIKTLKCQTRLHHISFVKMWLL